MTKYQRWVRGWTLFWVLRCVPEVFSAGVTLTGYGFYAMDEFMDEKRLRLPFQSFVTSYGPWPWFTCILVGAALLLYAWHFASKIKAVTEKGAF